MIAMPRMPSLDGRWQAGSVRQTIGVRIHGMWLTFIIVLALLLVGVAGIYWFLRSMGENGIEAAAPGSCRSGRCGVTARSSEIGSRAGRIEHEAMTSVAMVPLDEITRKDARSPNQTL
jgi:hypothetical protein